MKKILKALYDYHIDISTFAFLIIMVIRVKTELAFPPVISIVSGSLGIIFWGLIAYKMISDQTIKSLFFSDFAHYLNQIAKTDS